MGFPKSVFNATFMKPLQGSYHTSSEPHGTWLQSCHIGKAVLTQSTLQLLRKAVLMAYAAQGLHLHKALLAHTTICTPELLNKPAFTPQHLDEAPSSIINHKGAVSHQTTFNLSSFYIESVSR